MNPLSLFIRLCHFYIILIGVSLLWLGVNLVDADQVAGKESLLFGPSISTMANPKIDLQGFDLVSANEGWLLINQHLYWTKTGGQTWNDITPSNLGQSIIRAVSFLDTQYGWVILTNSDESGSTTYTIARTMDSGNSWQMVPLSLFESGDASSLAKAIFLHFIDSQTGWLVIKQATSSNFSLGTLFKTTDGGQSWIQLTIPMGEPVYFVTPEIGWVAGGVTGNELYRTKDGGQSWHPQIILPSKQQNFHLLYQLPVFENEHAGVLPVIIAEDNQTRVEFYVTDNGGESWILATSVPMGQEVFVDVSIPLSVLDLNHWMIILPNSHQLLKVSDNTLITIINQDDLLSGVTELDMVAPNSGWARYDSGNCTSVPATDNTSLPAQTIIRCISETRLLHTRDDGQTWTMLDLPQNISSTVISNLTTLKLDEELNNGGIVGQSIGSQTQILIGQGFDKCEIATLSQLQNWITNSPYRTVNLYIGGSARGCPNSALTASFILQLSQQGWSFIPTWVGPQAACSGFASRMSFDPTIAYNQGVNEANAAIEVANNLGLTLADNSGTIIYYDLEYYSINDTVCHDAAKSFISGWTAQLRNRGNQAGIYGNGPPINSFASLANVPDAIWPASWIYSSYNSTATVWDVYGLPNGLWNNHQRIRQYTGGHPETWGGITIGYYDSQGRCIGCIDSDVIDGIVADIRLAPPHAAVNTGPANGQWITNRTITFSWNPSPDPIDHYILRVSTNPDLDGSSQYWIYDQNVGTATSNVVTFSQDYTALYWAVFAHNSAGYGSHSNTWTTKIDATLPTNPTSINSGCSAANDVWQKTCNDANFTWSGASDAISGLAGYQYYWGTDPLGSTASWTTSTIYNPPAVNTGSYYLRLRTQDNASNWSSWATLFTFRYDNIAPTGSFSFSSGGLSYSTSPLLKLVGNDQHSGVATVQLSNNNSSWTPLTYASQVNWAIPANDGQVQTVYLKFVDAAGNVSPVYSQKVCLDLTPVMPSSAHYRLWSAGSIAGAGYASSGYRLYHTEGQPFAKNPQTNASYELHSGFQATWPASPGAELFTANGCIATPGGSSVYLPIIIKN